ncbi:MAG: hypothetical protein KA354_14325 [Phycisphaerae bacterium]|nr:hypothetical protein [Phycisphaerae bacterium]
MRKGDAMRAAKIVFLIWLLCELGLWVRGGQGFCVMDTLPFVQRPQSLSPHYEWLAAGAILIGLWGFLMLPRPQAAAQQTRRFRSELFLVPATIIALALVSERLHTTLSLTDLTGDPNRAIEHRHLAILCLCVYAALLAIKALRNR